ncbi:uncharacterized protein LOC131033459 [Cryptomeria japonica]|uniref:uncharacterized protein LOC131033459 n=1 Tax=Cryptomeria japonica TaxID=3369 RepID=UPI0027DA4BE9|nr:uncharacterized protein LOC131033459 [Cryptomeria japonica]
MGFQVDPRDGHPSRVSSVDVPHYMSSSWVSRVFQPITGATECSFLVGATNNHWANLFEVKLTGKSSFPPVSITCDKVSGKVAISIPDQVIDHNIAIMALTLVGKFFGPRPNIDLMRIFVSRRWKMKGQVDVSALPWGFYSFAFSCTEDIMTILYGGPWIMGRSSLPLKKWSPNMDLSEAFYETIPVWVKLSGLPLEYWHEDIFKGIVGVFGELLSIDPMTTAWKRMVYARIYVGVSRSKDLPSSVELVSKLGTLVQTIEFESLPFVCFLCKKAGHWVTKCPQNTKKDSNKGPIVWKPKLVDIEAQNKKEDIVHQEGPDGSHEINKENNVQPS